jgi:hypothetical protein
MEALARFGFEHDDLLSANISIPPTNLSQPTTRNSVVITALMKTIDQLSIKRFSLTMSR